MIYLTENQLKEIVGGISLSGTLVNAFTRAITTILDVGRSFGTAIRRISGKKICSL